MFLLTKIQIFLVVIAFILLFQTLEHHYLFPTNDKLLINFQSDAGPMQKLC